MRQLAYKKFIAQILVVQRKTHEFHRSHLDFDVFPVFFCSFIYLKLVFIQKLGIKSVKVLPCLHQQFHSTYVQDFFECDLYQYLDLLLLQHLKFSLSRTGHGYLNTWGRQSEKTQLEGYFSVYYSRGGSLFRFLILMNRL